MADGITTAFSGFGTVGGTFTSDGHYAYVHDSTEFAGASNSPDVGLESRIGVQAVVSFDSQWSVTAQEVAKLRGSTNFDPGTEWLFAQYQPDSRLRLRLGRVVLPVFLLSDSINVGYAAPWFRAPNDVYGAEPFDHLDGGQVLWQHDRFHCVGLQYDDGRALLMSEWTKRNQSNVLGLGKPIIENSNWYAAAGWRFGKFTPLVIYSAVMVTNSVFQNPASYHTWQASLRYDIVRNLDLKLQLSRAQASNSAYWVVPNQGSSEYVDVYSFGVDFVF